MTINMKVLVGQLAYLFLFFTLPLFLAAGTIAWLAGWIYVVLFLQQELQGYDAYMAQVKYRLIPLVW